MQQTTLKSGKKIDRYWIRKHYTTSVLHADKWGTAYKLTSKSRKENQTAW